jgi:hypothetical protein
LSTSLSKFGTRCKLHFHCPFAMILRLGEAVMYKLKLEQTFGKTIYTFSFSFQFSGAKSTDRRWPQHPLFPPTASVLPFE